MWSRRNGPWRASSVLWVGAAPGNAGGLGSGPRGAHGTRIPFGGDIAGANLDVLLGSVGLDRNRTFIVAAYNRLPAKGGGEPTVKELREPAGDFPDSIAILRETILAVGPRLVVALGNVALRTVAAALRNDGAIPTRRRLDNLGIVRGELANMARFEPAFSDIWHEAWSSAPPSVLWLTHPSGQNMSPFAGRDTAFHARMLQARQDLRRAARALSGFDLSAPRGPLPTDGIYALSEWRHDIEPVHDRLDRLWREYGV